MHVSVNISTCFLYCLLAAWISLLIGHYVLETKRFNASIQLLSPHTSHTFFLNLFFFTFFFNLRKTAHSLGCRIVIWKAVENVCHQERTRRTDQSLGRCALQQTCFICASVIKEGRIIYKLRIKKCRYYSIKLIMLQTYNALLLGGFVKHFCITNQSDMWKSSKSFWRNMNFIWMI